MKVRYFTHLRTVNPFIYKFLYKLPILARITLTVKDLNSPEKK